MFASPHIGSPCTESANLSTRPPTQVISSSSQPPRHAAMSPQYRHTISVVFTHTYISARTITVHAELHSRHVPSYIHPGVNLPSLST